jgi:hypothetical protein
MEVIAEVDSELICDQHGVCGRNPNPLLLNQSRPKRREGHRVGLRRMPPNPMLMIIDILDKGVQKGSECPILNGGYDAGSLLPVLPPGGRGPESEAQDE